MPTLYLISTADRTREEKNELARQITDRLQAVTGRPAERIRVIFFDVPQEDYIVAGKTVDSNTEEIVLRVGLLAGRSASQKKEIAEGLRDVLMRHAKRARMTMRIILEESADSQFFCFSK